MRQIKNVERASDSIQSETALNAAAPTLTSTLTLRAIICLSNHIQNIANSRRWGTMGRAMNEHDEHALKYRQKAEELRAMIGDMADDLSRQTLEKIAAGYDQLAKVQDGLAKTNRTISNL